MNCPFCAPEIEDSLTALTKGNKEFYLFSATADGTRKWYQCSGCEGVFCKDKMSGNWLLSPGTYDLFVARGWMKDVLS